MPLLTALIVVLIGSLCMAGNGGYLFVTFKGEQTPLTEQIYFAVSKDGRSWKALNDSKPVLVSNVGEKGVRDPYLLRTHDGKKFVLLATDLSIHLNHNWGRAVTAGSKCIVIWESDDLIHWSAPRLVKVAADDAGCTWAPEAVYDEQAGDYLVFWASKTGSDQFSKHRIWAARTKDFQTFSKPFIYIEHAQDVIDTDIVRDGTKYYRFSKDEKHSAITMESAESLMGDWTPVEGFTLATMRGYEGPECYQLLSAEPSKPPTWCLVLDHYSKGEGYKPYITTDLASGHFTPAADFQFPFKFRHGSILPISETEMQRLETMKP